MVDKLLKELGKNLFPSRGKECGEDWVESFLKRNGIIRKKKQGKAALEGRTAHYVRTYVFIWIALVLTASLDGYLGLLLSPTTNQLLSRSSLAKYPLQLRLSYLET